MPPPLYAVPPNPCVVPPVDQDEQLMLQAWEDSEETVEDPIRVVLESGLDRMNGFQPRDFGR